MCGITAVLLADTKGECGQEIFDALILLQHRGQDAAGIVTVCLATPDSPRMQT
jgi:glutamine phosphoribosylpyrophosphate amidotransferase